MTDAVTGKGIPRVHLAVWSGAVDPLQERAEVESDLEAPSGMYAIDLGSGDHHIEFSGETFYPDVPLRVSLAEGEVRGGVEIRLYPCGVMTGTVVESGTRSPIEGAVVRIDDWGGSTRTDADGNFALRSTRVGTVRLGVTHREFVRWLGDPFENVERGRKDGFWIELSRGGSIEGTVRRRGEAPVVGAEVRVSVDGVARSTRTTEDGQYRLDALPPGRAEVEFRDDGNPAGLRWTWSTSAILEGGRVARVDCDVGASWARTVPGRVTRRGQPVANALVRLSIRSGYGRAPGTEGVQSTAARSGDQGRFGVTDVYPGTGEATVAVDDSGRRSRPFRRWSVVVPEAPEPVFLSLELPTGSIEGRVLRGDDGAPVVAAGVFLHSNERIGRSTLDETSTDQDGRFRFDELGAGEYFVRVVPPGAEQTPPLRSNLAAARVGPLRVTDSSTSVDVVVSRPGSVSIRAFESDGLPVRDAEFFLVRENDLPRWRDRIDVSSSQSSDGEYRASGLLPGRYVAVAVHADLAPAVSEAFEVRPDLETVARLRMESGTMVRVRVVGPTGAVAGPFLALATDARGHEFRLDRSAAERASSGDRYSIVATLRPGRYSFALFPACPPLGSWSEEEAFAFPVDVGAASPQDVTFSAKSEGRPR